MDRNANKDQHRTGSDQQASDRGNQQDRDLPGYPHYPASEDIMNPGNGFEKTRADVESLANSRRLSSKLPGNQEGDQAYQAGEEDDDLKIVSGTEADVTREDLAILGQRQSDADLGDDELTGNARIDMIGEEEEDLDIPGADLDDENEAIGEEDEENNYYSLGGDRQDGLEEDQA